MLARPNRLSDRRDINRVRKYGKTYKSRSLELKSLDNRKQVTRATVVVSTKISKKAVARNTIRRRVIGLVAELWPELPAGYDLLFVTRADCSKLAAAELRQEVATCLKGAGLPVSKS